MKKGLQMARALPLVLGLQLAHAAEDESPWVIDGEATVGYDSNVARAAFERDVIDDAFAGGSLALAWNRELGMMSAVTVRGFVDGEVFADLDGLNRAGAGLQGIYRWQRALGFSAPFFQASLTAQTNDYGVALRDDDRYAAQLFMTRRFTDAFRASVGLEASAQRADGEAYDVDSARLFVNGDLALGGPWAVYGTYSAQTGDVVSSAQFRFCNGALAPDIFALVDAAEAIEADTALNETLCGDWLAYRLDALTHVFVVGANRGFGHALSMDVSAQHVIVQADGDNEYQRTIVRAGILARF